MRLFLSRFPLLSILILSIFLSACASTPEEGKTQEDIAEINTRLGLGYLKQGRLDDAISKLKKALEANPGYAEAHNAIAIVYVQTGQVEKAEHHYREAMELKPNDGKTYNNYGVFLCRQNRMKEAEEYFMLAVNTPRYRSPERAYENAGACVRSVDIEKAEVYLRLALSRNSKLPTALYEMAEISFQKGSYLSTRAYLQRFQEVSKHSPQSLWLGVRSERKLDDEHAAARYAKLLQQQYPDSLQFKWLLDSAKGE